MAVKYAVQISDVPAGRFTATTIKRMYHIVDAYRTDRHLQDLAASFVRGCPHKDYECFGNKILAAVKKVLQYVPDPFGIERIQDPWTTLIERRFDCDDGAVLLAVLGAGVGMDSRFVTVKARRDPNTGQVVDQWSHVYTILSPPGHGWYGADAVVPESYFGWEPAGYERKVWDRR